MDRSHRHRSQRFSICFSMCSPFQNLNIMNFLNKKQRFFRKLKPRQSSEPEVGSSQQEQLQSEPEVESSKQEHLQSEPDVGSSQQEQLQSSQSNSGVSSLHESTCECPQDRYRVEQFEYNPKPTFPYPKEHTIWLEYLGGYDPEPNWKRWLSPFHHKTPQNAFCRGITVKRESLVPPDFFRMLSRAVKRRLSRGYRVGVLTPNHKFYTKVSLKYTKADPEVWWSRSSYSMTFEDAGHGYWKSCEFDWGKTAYLDIWILLKRRPDRPISSTSITFLIQESTFLHSTFCRSHNELVCERLSKAVENAWLRFSEAVNKYDQKCRRRRIKRNIPEDVWEERWNNIINDFRANFHYNILVPFRQRIFCQWNLDAWGPPIKKIVRDPKFVDRFIKTLQTSKMIGSDLAIMPWAMSIWMTLQGFLNSKFEEIKVENWDVMFANPTKQDDVFDGNAPEVASFAISGNSISNDPIAIDPAIETTTYSVFLESIRDLPFKLNRWCQVVRRESKPIPFIRSLQFPCQKAYSAFATKMEDDAEILQRLELYRYFFEEILAVPVMKCKTNELEKFAVEAFLPNVVWGGCEPLRFKGACSIRGATAHCLGQNVLENCNKNGEKTTAWLNSWSCSIRVIGLMVMVHGNENGMVLPPKVAPKQVIVTSRLNINDLRIRDACNCVVDMFCQAGIRAGADLDDFPLSRKCWEDKGVPLLIKVGPEVCVIKQVEAHRRDCDKKEIICLSMTSMVEKVKEILDEIQESLFKAAKRRQDACIQIVKNWDEFVEAVRNMRVILAPWCDEEMVEKDVKAKLGFMSHGYGVKILCFPLEQPEITEDTKCFASGKPAKKWTYWGRKLLDEF